MILQHSLREISLPFLGAKFRGKTLQTTTLFIEAVTYLNVAGKLDQVSKISVKLGLGLEESVFDIEVLYTEKRGSASGEKGW